MNTSRTIQWYLWKGKFKYYMMIYINIYYIINYLSYSPQKLPCSHFYCYHSLLAVGEFLLPRRIWTELPRILTPRAVKSRRSTLSATVKWLFAVRGAPGGGQRVTPHFCLVNGALVLRRRGASSDCTVETSATSLRMSRVHSDRTSL